MTMALLHVARRRPAPATRWRRACMCGMKKRALCTGGGGEAGGPTHREKGMAFEARVERVMRDLDCVLVPTQMSMDGGIDHIGRWILPDMELEIVTQCKNEQKPVGVQHLREFYGVMGLRASPAALAVFFSASGYSIYAQRFFARAPHAAVLCTIDASERITEFLLNDRARAALPRLSVGSCFVDHQHELILTYGDQVLGS